MVPILIWLLIISCCAVGAGFGGRAGLWITVIFVIGSVATSAVQIAWPNWGAVHIPTLLVDLSMLAALMWVALSSRRYFPLWICGLHLIGITSHFAAFFVPHFAIKTYFILQGFWSIPMLVILATGALQDWQAGIRDERSGLSGYTHPRN